jgi:hypothetical protein
VRQKSVYGAGGSAAPRDAVALAKAPPRREASFRARGLSAGLGLCQASPTPLSPALIATLDRPFPEIASTFDWHIPLPYRADTVRDSSRLCPSWWNHCVSGDGWKSKAARQRRSPKREASSWLPAAIVPRTPFRLRFLGYLLFMKIEGGFTSEPLGWASVGGFPTSILLPNEHSAARARAVSSPLAIEPQAWSGSLVPPAPALRHPATKNRCRCGSRALVPCVHRSEGARPRRSPGDWRKSPSR